MQKLTIPTKEQEIKRAWHMIDVEGKVLGRQATKIAQLLIGKSKSYYTPHLDCGDNVVVVNAKHIEVTGKKEKDKIYTRYSGYPGGLKKITLEQMREKKPTEIVRHAVSGMLPKNKLRKRMLTRLYVYEGPEHNFEKELGE
jgi:large subunit ribosomal protein L13